MIDRLLRLIPTYRRLVGANSALDAKVRELAEAHIRAQDESIYWRRQADDLNQRLREVHERELKMRERVADFFAGRWGKTIFDSNAPGEFPVQEPAPLPSAKIQGRRLVQMRNSEALRDLMEANNNDAA